MQSRLELKKPRTPLSICYQEMHKAVNEAFRSLHRLLDVPQVLLETESFLALQEGAEPVLDRAAYMAVYRPLLDLDVEFRMDFVKDTSFLKRLASEENRSLSADWKRFAAACTAMDEKGLRDTQRATSVDEGLAAVKDAWNRLAVTAEEAQGVLLQEGGAIKETEKQNPRWQYLNKGKMIVLPLESQIGEDDSYVLSISPTDKEPLFVKKYSLPGSVPSDADAARSLERDFSQLIALSVLRESAQREVGTPREQGKLTPEDEKESIALQTKKEKREFVETAKAILDVLENGVEEDAGSRTTASASVRELLRDKTWVGDGKGNKDLSGIGIMWQGADDSVDTSSGMNRSAKETELCLVYPQTRKGSTTVGERSFTEESEHSVFNMSQADKQSTQAFANNLKYLVSIFDSESEPDSQMQAA
jgi:hypothetical protein